MPYRVLLLILALTPALASSATLDERLGDLEHAFKPDLDGTESAKPASPPPERFKLAPLGSVVRKKSAQRRTCRMSSPAARRWSSARTARSKRSLQAERRQSHLANNWSMSRKLLNSSALPQGSKRNSVACSPTWPLKRI